MKFSFHSLIWEKKELALEIKKSVPFEFSGCGLYVFNALPFIFSHLQKPTDLRKKNSCVIWTWN